MKITYVVKYTHNTAMVLFRDNYSLIFFIARKIILLIRYRCSIIIFMNFKNGNLCEKYSKAGVILCVFCCTSFAASVLDAPHYHCHTKRFVNAFQ